MYKSIINTIISLLIFLASPKAFGLAEFQQTIRLNVPPAVNVLSLNPSASTGTIAPQTGNSSSPAATFSLQSNGRDANYNYVVSAKLLTTGGTFVNAYSQNNSQPYILLGNNTPANYPTTASVSNITGGSPIASQNANVIAYPITNTLNNLNSVNFVNNPAYGGLCFVATTGNSQRGNLTQTLGTTPLSGTYSINNDLAGTYQAVVTFTANRRP